MHIDLLTPSLCTVERLRPRLNVQSLVRNHTLLLWFWRRDVTPSARSNRAPLLLLPHTPRRSCLAMTPSRRMGGPIPAQQAFRFVLFRASYRFAFQVIPHGVLNPM